MRRDLSLRELRAQNNFNPHQKNQVNNHNLKKIDPRKSPEKFFLINIVPTQLNKYYQGWFFKCTVVFIKRYRIKKQIECPICIKEVRI